LVSAHSIFGFMSLVIIDQWPNQSRGFVKTTMSKLGIDQI